jgi:hypothetical protein
MLHGKGWVVGCVLTDVELPIWGFTSAGSSKSCFCKLLQCTGCVAAAPAQVVSRDIRRILAERARFFNLVSEMMCVSHS